MPRRRLERGGTVSTTVVNLCELYSGACGSRPQKEFPAKVQDLVSDLGLLELDAGAAKRYGELVNVQLSAGAHRRL